MNQESIETALARSLFGEITEDVSECNFSSLEVFKRPLCGNELCEIGEAQTGGDRVEDSETICLADCPMTFEWCSLGQGFGNRVVACSGHGRCLYGSGGQCDCFDGYTGANCEDCAFGFYRLNDTDTRCLPRQNYVPLGDVTATGKLPGSEESFHAMDGAQEGQILKALQRRRILEQWRQKSFQLHWRSMPIGKQIAVEDVFVEWMDGWCF